MKRAKHTEQFCIHCKKNTKMEIVGEMRNLPEKIWLRCARCHHMNLVAQSDKEAIHIKEKGDINKATLYDPQRTYSIGESIFHSHWNDIGKVLSKIQISDGNQAIVVSFEKEGQRTLVENFKAFQNE